MKKQGDLYLKIVSIVLAVIILAYIVLSALFRSGSSYALETAVLCEAGDGQTVSGFVVRSEIMLTAEQPVVVCELAEGEHVGSGQRVATGYQSDTARTKRQELSSLRAQLEQLEYAADMDNGDTTALDEQIRSGIVQMAGLAAQQRLDAAQTVAAGLQPLVLRRSITDDDLTQVNSKISEIDGRIAELSTQAESGAVAVNVSSSGYFSGAADGYESILTPDAVLQMSLSELRSVQERRTAVPSNAVGRLILGQKWYFAAEVPTASLATCEVGERLTVSFAGESLQQLRMRIERIGEDEGGSCLLVLSCDRQLQDVTLLRQQTADIIFSTYSGLRVPKQALYIVDGEAGVYVLESARAEWKNVEILYEYGDSYIIALDKSSTDNLWPEDEIILTSKDIWDGKVMIES